jgi:DNA-binding FrmR family transcriptional regulator
MKNTRQLINNVTGQLNGINAMIEAQEDCFKVLAQFKAAKAGLNAVITRYLAENTDQCSKQGNAAKSKIKLKKLLSELVKSDN